MFVPWEVPLFPGEALTCPRTGSLSPWVVGLRGMAAGKGWRREAGRALRAAEDLAAEGWI